MFQFLTRTLLVFCMVFVQTACVSTGPQKISRTQTQDIQPGEEITLTLKDGRKIRSRFQSIDDSGINTDRGHFEHGTIRRMAVERFSAGETVFRTVGFVYLLGLAGAYMLVRALDDSSGSHSN